MDRGKRSGKSGGAAGEGAFLGDDVIGFIEALAALRGPAEAGVKILGTIAAAPRGGAQVFFADGIADADVHAHGTSSVRAFYC